MTTHFWPHFWTKSLQTITFLESMLQKKYIHQFLFEKLLIQKFCNLIREEHFWHNQLKILKSPLIFLQIVLSCKKSLSLTHLVIIYSWFKNSEIRKKKIDWEHFEPHSTKNLGTIFFSWTISACQKSSWYFLEISLT